MIKLAALRTLLEDTDSWIRADPSHLLAFVDNGKIVQRAGTSYSFEYRYTANLIVTDYPSHPTALITPIVAWLKVNQPESGLNPQIGEEAISFEADILNNKTIDLSIKLLLTERVIVTQDSAGRLLAEHVPEAQEDFIDWTEVFVKPETSPMWTVAEPEPV